MTQPSAAEQDRVSALLRWFKLEGAQDIILPRGKPAIVLVLEDRIFPRPDPWPDAPLGSSFMGGLPDLPESWDWPLFACEYTGDTFHQGFIMQIALAEMPDFEGNPLPRDGMLYLFHRDQCAEFDRSFQVGWFPGSISALRRVPPPDLPCASELDVCWRGEPFPLYGMLGTDFPPKGQHDDDVVEQIEARLGKGGDYTDPDSTFRRYLDFREQALFSQFDGLTASGVPLHWRHAGQLLGHVDRDNRHGAALSARGEGQRRYDYGYRASIAGALEEEGRAWPLLAQIETNAVTGFAGGCDAAPVLILRHDDGVTPWTDFSRIGARLAP